MLLVVLTAQCEQRLRQLRLARQPLPAVRQRAARQIADDAPGYLGDLVEAVRPGGDDTFEHLTEGRHAVAGLGREVRTEVEGLGVGGQEDGHRPATLTGRGLHGLHVHGVDVGPLLTVDLHVDEVLVHVCRGRFVLEALDRENMAPMAT